MSDLVWSNELSVGIVSIDNQHKELILLINELTRAMLKGESHKKLDEIFERMSKYTIEHFEYEENLLKQHGFEGLPGHQEEHKTLIEQMNQLKEKHISGKAAVSATTHKFLNTWLKNHIIGSDRKYTRFLVHRGVR